MSWRSQSCLYLTSLSEGINLDKNMFNRPEKKKKQKQITAFKLETKTLHSAKTMASLHHLYWAQDFEFFYGCSWYFEF